MNAPASFDTDLVPLYADHLATMKRRADERDGTTPETVKAGKVATSVLPSPVRISAIFPL